MAYRSDSVLARCLQSLRTATDALDHEVIVIDNAGLLSTANVVQEHLPGARYVDPGANIGFGRACNLGASYAAGDYLLFLNPDTVIPAAGLDAACAALDARPDVGVLGCKLVRAGGTFDHACKRSLPTPASSLRYLLRIDRFVRKRDDYRAAALDPDEEGRVGAVNGAFMLMRRKDFVTVDGFDEIFWMYGEDIDLCRRVALAGKAVLYWPRLTVVHLKAGTTGSARTWKVNFAFHQSMWLYYKKHCRGDAWPLRAAVWTGIYARLLLTAGASSGFRVFDRARRLASQGPAL